MGEKAVALRDVALGSGEVVVDCVSRCNVAVNVVNHGRHAVDVVDLLAVESGNRR